MRPGIITLATVLLALAVGAPAEPPSVETAIAPAVESFEPLWSPPAGELKGWVIGIDPVALSPSHPGARRRDDLSLLTAAHLYQFVRAGGGTPVLTRVDHTHAADPDGLGCQQRVAVVRAAACDLCVSIRHDQASAGGTVRHGAADAHPADARLADALIEALDAEPGDRGSGTTDFIAALHAAEGFADVAACEVRFGCPGREVAVGVASRKACRDNAQRLCMGVIRFCAANRRTAASPAKRSAGTDYSGPRRGSRLADMARSIWPHGRLPAERLEWFCDTFARLSITNRSLVYFEVSARLEADVVVLRGRTAVPSIAGGLEKALQAVGLERVRNEVQPLPDRARLGEHLFGACQAPMALTYGQSGRRGGVQTQLLFGEPLFLLDRTEDHYLLLAGDGYWGWVHRDAVQPMTAEQFDAYRSLPLGVARANIDDRPVMIPRGAGVRVARVADDELVIALPDGSTLAVPAAKLALPDAGGHQAAARVRAALDLLYVPYVFGGRSPLGLDCSGLVSNVQARAGHTPSRDAWQQAFAGVLVATAWHRTGIQPGDQLFFINSSGKVYHTGVALGPGLFLHAAPPWGHICSLAANLPGYVGRSAGSFLMATRP